MDTGSQVTEISEKFYERLKCKKIIQELPVSNVIVSTAIGNKNTTVKKQALLDFECDGYTNNHVCLIIPYLSSDIILAKDWNLRNGIEINYNNQSIHIKEKVISKKSVLFERSVLEKICTSQNKETTFIYIISVNEKYDKIKINTGKDLEKCQVSDDYKNDDENEILYGDEITKNGKRNNLVINEIYNNNKKK